MSSTFSNKVKDILNSIDASILEYNHDEFWMVEPIYDYIEKYAYEKEFINTAIALPLVRGLHNGSYRKLTITRNGNTYRLPYIIHPLLVTRMLLDMHVNLSCEEKDILFASALGHDLLEDIKFENGGKELIEEYHLDPRILDIIKLMSKRYDFTEDEEKNFFHNIGANKFSALIKLSDRGNNVEDLYNMSLWKVHEYIDETNKFFLPICIFAKRNFPELSISFDILEDKIVSLTGLAEALVDHYSLEENNLRNKIDELKKENDELRISLNALRDEGVNYE